MTIYDEPHTVYEITPAGRGIWVRPIASANTRAAALTLACRKADTARSRRRRAIYRVQHWTSTPDRLAILRRLRARRLIG